MCKHKFWLTMISVTKPGILPLLKAILLLINNKKLTYIALYPSPRRAHRTWHITVSTSIIEDKPQSKNEEQITRLNTSLETLIFQLLTTYNISLKKLCYAAYTVNDENVWMHELVCAGRHHWKRKKCRLLSDGNESSVPSLQQLHL